MFEDLKNEYEGKGILVTGGAGSIGSKLVKLLLEYNPGVVRVLDNNERNLFELEQDCRGKTKRLRLLVGDVRDPERLSKAMRGVDYVFHTAALKHVYLNEYSPFEAVKTNVLGTQNVIDMALENDVKKVIFISTDKAVNPTSVMGTTKLLGEKLMTAANYHRGTRRTIFCSVRFGNVLVSSGSVVPIFLEQIKNGGPITVTDPKMTRFIMPNSRAVELVLKSASIAKGGEIFILKMPAIKIIDLAEIMVKKFAVRFDRSPKDIKINVIGARPGEKLHEEILTAYESMHAIENDGILILPPMIDTRQGMRGFEEFEGNTPDMEEQSVVRKGTALTSDRQLLSKEELDKLLDSVVERFE